MHSLAATLSDLGMDLETVDLGAVDRWQRLPTTDKPGKRNGAVIVKPDGAVIIRNWATDQTAVWQPDKEPLAPRRAKSREQTERAAQRRAQAQADAQARARAIAQKTWDRARSADRGGESLHSGKTHPYLARKKLPALELRRTDVINGWREDWLICPLYTLKPMQRIVNLECINSKGDKRPIKGALRSGVFGYVGPGVPLDDVIICEGWATAAALHVSLNVPIIYAAGKGNLVPVAQAWRAARRDAGIFIAADDDEPGMAEAKKAAAAVGAWIKKPNFGLMDGNDWCDVYTRWGVDVVREGWLRG